LSLLCCFVKLDDTLNLTIKTSILIANKTGDNRLPRSVRLLLLLFFLYYYFFDIIDIEILILIVIFLILLFCNDPNSKIQQMCYQQLNRKVLLFSEYVQRNVRRSQFSWQTVPNLHL